MNRLAAVAVATLVACSSSSGSGGNGGGGNGGGSGAGGGSGGGSADAGSTAVTLSGARSSTISGPAPDTRYTPSVDNAEVSLIIGNAVEQVAFDFQFAGEPAVHTYVGDTDAGIFCNIYDTLDGGLDGWLANRGAGIPDLGDCSLTLTSVSLKQDNVTQKQYNAHGSVTATLPHRSGNATGTIDFSASF